MKRLYFILLQITWMCTAVMAQTTSWTGTTSTAWSNAANWTNGIPTAALDVVIGDANFTGSFQPTISSSATAKSLTIGGGAKASTLTVSRNITVSGSVLINSNGTINSGAYTITLTGNWTKNGTYTGTSTSSRVTFAGTTQTISSSGSAQTFRRVTVNTGSTVTATVATSINVLLTVNGTFDPGIFTHTVAATTVANNGMLHVRNATVAGSYGSSTFTLNAGSIVNYSSTTTNQTVNNAYTYSTLRISGTGTKTLQGNLPALRSSASTQGNIYVDGGIFDLSTFTAARGILVAGGVFTVANGATLKIGGTNTFPANYATRTFGLSSTVEYSGAAQTVSAQDYGNLTLSSSSGSVVKTMPATALTIAGNLVSTPGSGTGVSFTAAANIKVLGNTNIGASTTFNLGSFIDSVSGNWVNNGTFTGSTGTVVMNGPATSISGSGTHTFNNLTIAASDITSTAPAVAVTGNLATSGAGTFTHVSPGTLTMSGTTRTISGTGIIFDNLTVSGTITTASSFTLTGTLSVAGSLVASAGTVTLSGASKTISGSGTKTFRSLVISGSVTTDAAMSVNGALNVSGTFSATTPSVVTFAGSSTLNGTANLFSVTLNGTQLQLATDAVLGIANTLTVTAGTLNVSAVPNTVTFNGSIAQSVNGLTYNNLVVSGGGTKTAAAAITVTGDLTIENATSLAAGNFTHTVSGNWTNSGSFTAGSGTVQFTGAANSVISGATTFNTLVVNKASASTGVTLASSVTVPVLTMTTGWMNTDVNTVTITSTRTGPGFIYGTIQHLHSFTGGVAYAFEGPDNLITVSGTNALTSITVTVTPGSISDFPFNGSVSRVYNIALAGSLGASTVSLRLHYEDNELNGNAESSIQLWRYSGSWAAAGKTSNNTTANFVELTGIASPAGRWTFSDDANVVQWTGAVSNAWNLAGNWNVVQGSASAPPAAGDIVQLGMTVPSNQPAISTGVTVKNIVFGSAAAITLTLSTGGSLTTSGINGAWSANATHTIAVAAQSLVVNGDLTLSDGASGRAINLTASTGSIGVTGSLTQSGGANITYTGNGTLSIGSNFTYVSGTFTPGTGTVIYNGALPQAVAGVPYNNLTISKTSGIATKTSGTPVNGNLAVAAGELDLTGNTTIAGNITISSGAILNGGAVTTTLGGNWINNGTFVPATGTVVFNGTGTQSVSASAFNNITISKASGTATLGGNLTVAGNMSVQAGTLDLGTFSANRNLAGGSFTMSNGAAMLVGGSFPSNYAAYTLGNTSTVTYNGTVAQTVAGITYGNLVFANGGANAKTLAGAATVNGDLTIGSGSSFAGSTFTVTLGGNWVNNGTFTPATSTVVFAGTSKTISGNTTFNRMTITGSYTVNNNDIIINGRFFVTSTGSYTAGSGTHTVNSDFTNSGVLTSTGVTTFSGLTTQTIQLQNAITSNSSGVINFNGTVSPVLNSNSVPTYAILNINNTGGVKASVGWKVLFAFTIGSGASFDGGPFADTISGSFTNNGTMTSSGTLFFNPSTNVTIAMGSGFSSTGTVRVGGTGAVTITGAPAALRDVIISNTNANGITPPSGWTITGDFAIRSNAIFNAGSFTHTVGGNIESNGTLNGGTSTFIMTLNGGSISGSAGTTFNNLTLASGSNIAANSDFNIAANFTNNGAFDGTDGTLIMVGTGASVIGGSTTPSTISQLAVSKTGAATTLAVNISAVTEIEVLTGIFNTSTFSVMQDAGGGILSINDYATLQLGGTNTLPAFNTYSIDTFSTIEYNGSGSQSVSAAVNYGNLILSGSGTKTAAAALTVLNNFTLSSGTFTGGSFTHTLKGNWTMTGGSFTNTGTTILLNAAGPQALRSTGEFNNLTINKASGLVYDSTNITVNGVLTLTSGNISTGSNRHIIAAGGSVSRTSGHIIGNLQKNVALGATTRTFEIGDSLGYTPVTIAFANVTTAGDLNATTTAGDHADIAASQINPLRSVNRIWSLTNSGIIFTTYSLTPTFLASDVDAGATTSAFYLAQRTGGNWTLPAVGTRTATTTQATGITAFGDFIAGEISSREWDGGAGTNNWTDASNWNPDGVPGATEDTRIKIAATVQIASAVTVNGLLIDNASSNVTLNTGGSLTLNGILALNAGELRMNGQSLTLNGTMASAGTGSIRGAANSSLTIGGTTGGSFGTIRMSGASPANRVASFTLNRTGAAGSVTLGINGLEATSVVTLTNGTLNTGGNLTLVSSSLTNTARIATIGAGAAISGNVIVQRFIPAGSARRFEFLGSPISGFTFAQLIDNIHITGPGGTANGFDGNQSGAPSAYMYNESTAGLSSVGWYTPATINSAVANGTGMRVFFRGNRSQGNVLLENSPPLPQSVVLDFVGAVNTGTVTLPVSCSNGCGTEDGWNLVSNPYPSPIDWNAASGWTKTNISPSIYIYNPNSNAYAVWDGSVGTNGGSGFIPLGQSFFVKAIGAPALSMTEAVKTASLPAVQMFKTTQLEYARIRLEKEQVLLDEHVIRFSDNARRQYDAMEDAVKLYSAAADVSTFSSDNVLLAINHYTKNITSDSIRMNISVREAGSYTLHFAEFFRMDEHILLHLYDAYTGTVTALHAGSIYPFTVSADPASQGNTRFVLVAKKETKPNTGTADIPGRRRELSIYPVPSADMIYIPGVVQQGVAELIITDMVGKVVMAEKMVSTGSGDIPVTITGLREGVYIVELKGLTPYTLTGRFIRQ
jgi:fibronectin-binding autotransporter adhesin